MSKTYIIGHTKPDTDAVVAAIGLQYLYEQKSDFFNYKDIEAVITDPLNPETDYLFSRFGVTPPRQISATDIAPTDQIILIDHNEASQRLEGIDPNQIVEIIDHHKANLNLNQPIYMTFKAWGSSSTIISFMMNQMGVTPDATLAALMLAAILSDTVGFKSSTTHEDDRTEGQRLATLSNIDDLEAFTLDIFKAKSNVSSLSAKQMVLNDFKIFDFGDQKVLIDQIETVEQADIISKRKSELLAAMAKVKKEKRIDQLFVAVTDVLLVNTKMLILSESEAAVAKKAFGGQVIDRVLDIGPKLSRKKDIAPPIETALTK